MKLPAPPLPKALRRSPPRPGQDDRKNGKNGKNGRNGAPATRPTPKEQAIEGTASVVVELGSAAADACEGAFPGRVAR